MAPTDAMNYWIGSPQTVVSFVRSRLTKYAKFVGTMIGLRVIYIVGLRHAKFIQRARKINETSKSLVERLVDFKKVCLVSAWGPHPHPMRQRSRKNPKRCSALQLTPTTLSLLTSYERDPCAVSAMTYVEFISPIWLPVSERPPVQVRSSMAWLKFGHFVNTTVLLFMLRLPKKKKDS